MNQRNNNQNNNNRNNNNRFNRKSKYDEDINNHYSNVYLRAFGFQHVPTGDIANKIAKDMLTENYETIFAKGFVKVNHADLRYHLYRRMNGTLDNILPSGNESVIIFPILRRLPNNEMSKVASILDKFVSLYPYNSITTVKLDANLDLLHVNLFKTYAKINELHGETTVEIDETSIEKFGNKYTLSVSLSDKLGKSRIRNKANLLIKANSIFKTFKSKLNGNYSFKDDARNPHDVLGSLRRIEENETMIMMQTKYSEFKFIGIGENLARFSDIGGLYFNHGVDVVDKDRIQKYRENTLIPDQSQVDAWFNRAAQLTQGQYVCHSTDVLYYFNDYLDEIENLKRQIFIASRQNIMIEASVHTFGVFTSEPGTYKYDWGYIEIDDNKKIKMQPKGNPQPYSHSPATLGGKQITIEFIDELIENGEAVVLSNYLNDYVVILKRIWKVTSEYYYVTVEIIPKQIAQQNGSTITFRNEADPINPEYLIKEKEEEKEKDKILKIEKVEEKPRDEIYKQIWEWINGNLEGTSRVLIERKDENGVDESQPEIVIIKDTLYLNYRQKPFLDMIKAGKYESSISLKKSKVNFEIKINKVIFNKICSLYKRSLIEVNQIHAVVNQILSKNQDDNWGIEELTADKAKNLAILAARTMAVIRKDINDEYELNKNLYTSADTRGVIEKIADTAEKIEEVKEVGKKVVKAVLNSDAYEKVIKLADRLKPIKEKTMKERIKEMMIDFYIKFLLLISLIYKPFSKRMSDKYKMKAEVISYYRDEQVKSHNEISLALRLAKKAFNDYNEKTDIMKFLEEESQLMVLNKIAKACGYRDYYSTISPREIKFNTTFMCCLFPFLMTFWNSFLITISLGTFEPEPIKVIKDEDDENGEVALFFEATKSLLKGVSIFLQIGLALYTIVSLYQSIRLASMLDFGPETLKPLTHIIIACIVIRIARMFACHMVEMNWPIFILVTTSYLIEMRLESQYEEMTSTFDTEKVVTKELGFVIGFINFLTCAFNIAIYGPRFLILILIDQFAPLIKSKFGVVSLPIETGFDTNVEINIGSCTANNTVEMLDMINKWMKKNFMSYEKYNAEVEPTLKRNYEKFKILNYKSETQKNRKECTLNLKSHKPMNDWLIEPLIRKSFQLNGYQITKNQPYKLHKCEINELEALYRQVSATIDYDDAEVQKFKAFAKHKIDQLIDEFEVHNDIRITPEGYLKVLGPKRHEFEEGQEDYHLTGKINKNYKMHSKVDEKIYIDWNSKKMKSRNISAQDKTAKFLMGLVTDYGMKIIHTQEWSGPGYNCSERCEKYQRWIDEIGTGVGVLCGDGSAFDSTQFEALLKCCDNYFMTAIIRNHPEIGEYVNIADVEKVCNQTEFKIFSEHFTYKMKGTQMTGRMNTCLGNTMRSWLYISYIIHNMPSWVDKDKIKFEVCGDDQILFMEKRLYDVYEESAYKHVYARADEPIQHGLGQIAKIFDRYPKITGAEFLSMYVIYNEINGKVMMIRKPERFLQLTPYTYSNNRRNPYQILFMNGALTEADADGILAAPTITFFRKYALKMKELGRKQQVAVQKFIPPSVRYRLIGKSKEIIEEKFRWHDKWCKIEDIQEMDKCFEEFMNEKFGIMPEDFTEYYEALESLKDNNETRQIALIDKLYKNMSNEKYESTYEFIHRREGFCWINRVNRSGSLDCEIDTSKF